MQSSQEKLVAGLAALLPVAREAFSRPELSRQINTLLSGPKMRSARQDVATYTHRFVKNNLGNNKLARQLAWRLAPRPSRLPAIGLALVGAGLVWGYLARKKARAAQSNASQADDVPQIKEAPALARKANGTKPKATPKA